jgi:hypothetical protein
MGFSNLFNSCFAFLYNKNGVNPIRESYGMLLKKNRHKYLIRSSSGSQKHNFFLHFSRGPLHFELMLRQCVPVTFSKSGVFSGKWDPEPGNSGPEFPVDFRSGKEVRNLVFFESPKIGPKIGP